MDRDALGPQGFGEVPHRGKQEGDLAFVMTDIGDLLDHLGHQHDILRRIEIGKTGEPTGQLVTQNKPQRPGHQSAPSRSALNAANADSRDSFRSTTGCG